MRYLVISVFLYACESWTLTTEEEKRTQAFEMRRCRKVFKILYNDHITNEEGAIRSKQLLENKMSSRPWPHFKVFWLGR